MPFKITHGEQIKLISSFDWLDVDTLEDLGGEVREILNIDGSTIEIERSVAISEMFERRISPPLSTIMDSHTQASDDSRTDLVLRIV